MRKSVMVAAAAAFSLTLAACGEKGADAAKDTTAMAPAEATASNDQGATIRVATIRAAMIRAARSSKLADRGLKQAHLNLNHSRSC